MAQTAPAAPSTTGANPDAALDAGAYDDNAYLEQLGYKPQLDRALGIFSSFGVQFSMVAIGSATFTTLIVGLNFFGPAMFWSYLIGGLGQMLVGLAIAELVSCYPLAGGVYQITNRITRKPFLGFQAGWAMVVAHVVSVPAIAVSIAPFVASWFGWEPSDNGLKLLVLGIVVLATVVNLVGVRIAAMVNNVGVVAEIIGFAVIIIALIVVSHDRQPISFLTETGGTTQDGWIKPFLFSLIFPAYIISSFDSTGNTAEETNDAARQAPRGVVIANFASWVYGAIGIALILLAITDLKAVQESDTPVKLILDQAIGGALATGFEYLAVAALFAAMVMLQLTAARVLWSQARDGQMPAADIMKRVSKDKIPVNAVLVTLVLSSIIVIWSSLLSVLAALTALAWASCYGLVVIAGYRVVSRGELPAHPWGYGKWSKLIFGSAIVWSVILCGSLIWSDPKNVGLGMLGAIVAGVVVYFLIPASRRGKVVGVTDAPIKAGAEITV